MQRPFIASFNSRSTRKWAIPWACLHEFLAIVTHPRIFKVPSSMDDAWAFLDALLESPPLHLLAETRGYRVFLEELLKTSKICGPRVHDVRIAAVCLSHGVQTLWSADRDFARFQNLKTHNPLLLAL